MSSTRIIKTMCPMNCHPTYCGMTVHLHEDRVVKIDGDPDNPDSQGFLCIRGRATSEILDNPQRLLQPLRRVGPRGSNQWEPIAWETALTSIVDAIRQTDRQRVGIWMGHGAHGTGVSRHLLMRLGYLGGFQVWNPAMVCWALGAFGLGLTGVLECNTKEDMAAHSQTIFMWGANLASQPTTAPHLIEARRRGATVVVIDCRRTETARHADEVVLIRPGTDAALALAMAQVIIAERLTAPDFIADHTLGYAEFVAAVVDKTPEWAAPITGVDADTIRRLARVYATQTPAMIVLGGSSPFKHEYGWEVGRAVACLPALTGQLGRPGVGFGPRHRGLTRGDGYAPMDGLERRVPGDYIPNHMPSMEAAFSSGDIDVLLLFGTNMLSSFANAGVIEQGLRQAKLVVATDIFMNHTIRRVADIILPGTIWLEELGVKDTATHLYLMERALAPAGEARPIVNILRELAARLEIDDFFPWETEERYINAMLGRQRTPQDDTVTVDTIRAAGGYWQRSGLSHVAYPDLRFHTPSGKIEFWSERARQVGLPPLPSYTPSAFVAPDAATAFAYPLQVGQGRTLTHFHSFYDEGQALPTLARANPTPEIWVHPQDAQARGVTAGAAIVIYNQQGDLQGVARVTEDVQPGVVWLRDGWFGLNHLTRGVGALSATASGALDPHAFPGGQSAYDARVELRPA